MSIFRVPRTTLFISNCVRATAIVLIAIAIAPEVRSQTVLFSDDLSTGAGWEFSHFGGTAKPGVSDISEADFGFDYSALGIPEAPNTEVGDPNTTGLRLAANTPGLWGGDQVAAVYEDPNFNGQYTLQVDIWLNWAAAGGSGSGTTEHAGALVGFNLEDAQSGFAPGQNGGGFLFSSDGDASCNGGICDYMLVKDGAELDLSSGQYDETDFGGGNQPGYNHNDSNVNVDIPALFPSFDISAATGGLNGSGTQPAGALGFQWVTATLEVDASATGSGSNGKLGTVKVTLESASSGSSLVLGTIDNSVDDDPFDGENTEERAANLEGGIGLMLTDYFNSGASNPTLAFGLFDNVRVYDGLVAPSPSSASAVVPEQSTLVLLLLASVFCGSFYRRQLLRVRMHRRIPLAVLVTIMTCTTWNPAFAILNLTGNFDHGSLESWSGDLTNIDLVGRDNYYGGGVWRWMYFQASDVQGAQPVFTIDQGFAGGNSVLTNHKMVYSYDNENWTFFDNGQRSGNVYTFSNNTPFTDDEVYVAYAQPYSYARSAAHTAQILATPWAAPTVSGDANGVVGQTPIAFDDLGRLNPKKDIFAYRVTNPATDSASPKRKVVVTTGLHAGETLGTHTFEGLINWLTSDDSRAARLRDDAEFFAYPTLNAAGRFAGNNRATVENPNQEPNGLWHPSLWGSHEDIKASGEAMIADVASTPGTEVDAFIDFHSTISNGGDDFGFIEISEGDANAPWWIELRNLQPNVGQVESEGMNWTTANFGDLVLNADVDVTFETAFGNNRPLSYYDTLGANFGIAFYNAWIQVVSPDAADFDEDGDVDEADLTAWQNGYGTTGTAEHHQGDADGDMDVDGDDFLTWQAQFTGSLPFQAVATSVPEPSTGILLLGMLAFASRERRSSRSRERAIL